MPHKPPPHRHGHQQPSQPHHQQPSQPHHQQPPNHYGRQQPPNHHGHQQPADHQYQPPDHQYQPPNHQYQPPHRHRPRPSSRTNFASCIVATVFLVFVVIVVLIVFFTVFRPKDPEISVASVQLPSFSVSNSSVSFTFSQYASVRNPNRAVFTHYDSSLQLLYSGNQVGFMFIPAGKIAASRTQYMAATFAVQSFPLAARLSPTAASSAAEVQPVTGPVVTGGGIGYGGSVPGGGGAGYRVGPTLEIESRLVMKGRVRVLHFFTHHARTSADCRVTIAVTDGSVLGFHC
ncbi:hypothetical protein CDL15_Pgr027999 [Punica granatum]|uniref:Uncharacterized protein n=1 Tax=Punica granatum TaxID=22663 RepID=A0A218XLL3_PUNGR|nr:hypothetical protein CDL15_Pgr027999 [Punica granatum]